MPIIEEVLNNLKKNTDQIGLLGDLLAFTKGTFPCQDSNLMDLIKTLIDRPTIELTPALKDKLFMTCVENKELASRCLSSKNSILLKIFLKQEIACLINCHKLTPNDVAESLNSMAEAISCLSKHLLHHLEIDASTDYIDISIFEYLIKQTGGIYNCELLFLNTLDPKLINFFFDFLDNEIYSGKKGNYIASIIRYRINTMIIDAQDEKSEYHELDAQNIAEYLYTALKSPQKNKQWGGIRNRFIDAFLKVKPYNTNFSYTCIKTLIRLFQENLIQPEKIQHSGLSFINNYFCHQIITTKNLSPLLKVFTSSTKTNTELKPYLSSQLIFDIISQIVSALSDNVATCSLAHKEMEKFSNQSSSEPYDPDSFDSMVKKYSEECGGKNRDDTISLLENLKIFLKENQQQFSAHISLLKLTEPKNNNDLQIAEAKDKLFEILCDLKLSRGTASKIQIFCEKNHFSYEAQKRMINMCLDKSLYDCNSTKIVLENWLDKIEKLSNDYNPHREKNSYTNIEGMSGQELYDVLCKNPSLDNKLTPEARQKITKFKLFIKIINNKNNKYSTEDISKEERFLCFEKKVKYWFSAKEFLSTDVCNEKSEKCYAQLNAITAKQDEKLNYFLSFYSSKITLSQWFIRAAAKNAWKSMDYLHEMLMASETPRELLLRPLSIPQTMQTQHSFFESFVEILRNLDSHHQEEHVETLTQQLRIPDKLTNQYSLQAFWLLYDYNRQSLDQILAFINETQLEKYIKIFYEYELIKGSDFIDIFKNKSCNQSKSISIKVIDQLINDRKFNFSELEEISNIEYFKDKISNDHLSKIYSQLITSEAEQKRIEPIFNLLCTNNNIEYSTELCKYSIKLLQNINRKNTIPSYDFFINDITIQELKDQIDKLHNLKPLNNDFEVIYQIAHYRLYKHYQHQYHRLAILTALASLSIVLAIPALICFFYKKKSEKKCLPTEMPQEKIKKIDELIGLAQHKEPLKKYTYRFGIPASIPNAVINTRHHLAQAIELQKTLSSNDNSQDVKLAKLLEAHQTSKKECGGFNHAIKATLLKFGLWGIALQKQPTIEKDEGIPCPNLNSRSA